MHPEGRDVADERDALPGGGVAPPAKRSRHSVVTAGALEERAYPGPLGLLRAAPGPVESAPPTLELQSDSQDELWASAAWLRALE